MHSKEGRDLMFWTRLTNPRSSPFVQLFLNYLDPIHRFTDSFLKWDVEGKASVPTLYLNFEDQGYNLSILKIIERKFFRKIDTRWNPSSKSRDDWAGLILDQILRVPNQLFYIYNISLSNNSLRILGKVHIYMFE